MTLVHYSSNPLKLAIFDIKTKNLLFHLFLFLCDSRWDINAMDQLPDYMKICFLILYNFVNEMAFDPLKEQGFHIIRYLKKAVLTLFDF